MKITINGEEKTLQKRQRAVGSEAPAVKLKLKSGEDKVIGMMADKIQLICTLSHEPSDELVEIITEENRNFDLEGFKKALDEAVNFKRKGHVHENWMRY